MVKNGHDEGSVEFELVGDSQFKIYYNRPLLNDHFIDYPSVPKDKQPGQMRKLLSASVLGCFTGTVYVALASRGAHIKSLISTATATTASDNGKPPVIKSIDIRVEVDIDDKDLEILDKVKRIAKKGCLIARSIAPSIAVTHTIVRTRVR